MRTIAFIDDEIHLGSIIKLLFEDHNVTVHVAELVADGLPILTREQLDLAIIDIDLPDGSGLALAEVAVERDTPVVMISAHLSVLEGTKELGFLCLQKPFLLSTLETEAIQVIADRKNFVNRTRASIARLWAAIWTLEDGIEPGRLIDIERSIVDRAALANLR